MLILEIVNIVAIAIMQEPFDLDLISQRLKDTEFPSSRPGWLKMRLKPENYYTAFYKSGKFLITGAKNIDIINEIVQRVLNKLNDAGINAKLKNIKINNIVLMDKIELKQSLNNLISNLPKDLTSFL